MTEPASHPKWSDIRRVDALRSDRDNAFELRPSGDDVTAIAAELGLLDLKKLRLAGKITAIGAQGWRLTGDLGATVVQPCVVTGDPVTTRLDVPVERAFVPLDEDFEAGSETEMPEDDSVEPLGDTIDLGAVMVETLSLALPDYPRKDGVEPQNMVYTEPGMAPMTDDDAKPFAGLKGLKDKLDGKN